MAIVFQGAMEGTTMSNACTRIASARYAGNLGAHSSVQRNLTTGVAAASAGVLALSLVAVPTDAREVQPSALVHSPTTLSAAILEQYVGRQDQTALRGTPVVIAAEERTGGFAADPARLVHAIRPLLAATHQIGIPARSTVLPAIQSQRIADSALPSIRDLSDRIVGSILLLFLFGVVTPAFLAVIYVTSAVNVVLNALGLPLLPNVPDPPFGPAPPVNAATAPVVETNLVSDDPVVPQPNGTAASAGGVEDNSVLSHPVLRKVSDAVLSARRVDEDIALTDPVSTQSDQTVQSTNGVGGDAPLSDVVEHDPDVTSEIMASSDTMNQSPRFMPKRRARDRSSVAATSARTPVESAADNASAKDRHPAGDSGQK
ncbi:MAG TPA: hypothetical protein VFK56_18405, partial [Mycobacterium sp.]|nr:hypothetical protein [Mycobacterium sp.]